MVKKLFSKKTAAETGRNDAANDVGDELALAIAALMVEAARADDHYEEREKTIITRGLATMFELKDDAAAALCASAEKSQAEALDIQRFTRIAKTMTADDKITFLETMWEIILSDGERDPYEDTLMRRICGLIYVEDRESGHARARVEARLSAK